MNKPVIPVMILSVVVLIVVVLIVLLIQMRTQSQRVFESYDQLARQSLKSNFTLSELPMSETYRLIHPWKTLKLIKVQAENYQASSADGAVKLVHVTMLNTDIAGGAMKMYTLLIRPDYGYNLPILSVDVMLIGSTRMVYIEMIDPAGTTAESWQAQYNSLSGWQAELQAQEQRPVTEWQKAVLHPYSIHIKSDAEHDAWLLEVFQAYLTAYLDMARNAQPTDAAASASQRAAIEGYVANLLNQGGPAVDTFKTLVGEEGQKIFVRQVMFGIDSPK